MKLLIIDDDVNISNILSVYLKDEGFDVDTLNDSTKAKMAIANGDYDLVLLDIMMPDIDGFDICKNARYFTDIPILFITCLDDEESLEKALEYGGDDYIQKPFNIKEVILRVKAHLRRVERLGRVENNIYETSGYTYHYGKKVVIHKDVRIHLSPIESDLLKLFLDNRDTMFSYETIYESIWHEPYMWDKGTIMTRVSHLRQKLPGLNIKSVRNKGYVFVEDNTK
jgi:DNA-binding response OmpR family regulator